MLIVQAIILWTLGYIIPIYLGLSSPPENARLIEATDIAQKTVMAIGNLFKDCLHTSMPNQQFAMDNLQKFVFSPAKTTVGFAPKFTSNRRFFANMLASPAFKEMLAKDEEELTKDLRRKMRFCCSAIMDQRILKDFYDREVDQSKL